MSDEQPTQPGPTRESDEQEPQPREVHATATIDDDKVVVVTPDAMGVADRDPEGKPSQNPADLVEQPAKVMRIGSMIKQLLEEVRNAPLDEKGRARLADVHERSLPSSRTVSRPSSSRSSSASRCRSARTPPRTPSSASPRPSSSAGSRASSTGSRPRSSPSRWRPRPSSSRCVSCLPATPRHPVSRLVRWACPTCPSVRVDRATPATPRAPGSTSRSPSGRTWKLRPPTTVEQGPVSRAAGAGRGPSPARPGSGPWPPARSSASGR